MGYIINLVTTGVDIQIDRFYYMTTIFDYYTTRVDIHHYMTTIFE